MFNIIKNSQVFIIIILHFITIRYGCSCYIADSIRRKQLRELKSGQTLKEWLFYGQGFCNKIPNFMLIEYFIALIWDICGVVGVVIMKVVNIIPYVISFYSKIYFYITIIWFCVHTVVYYKVDAAIMKGESIWRKWIDPNPKRKKR